MLSAVLATAYTPTPLHRAPAVCQPRVGNVICLAEPVAPRRAVLAAALGLGATGVAPAFAAFGSGLGIVTTLPKDAEKDQELLNSEQVKKALSELNSYKQKASSLQGTFQKDLNMQLIPIIRKEFDFGALRDSLNLVTTVFDDQTQLTTDRVSRSILYDLTELENASRFKKGETERTQKKLDNVNKWFAKLDADLANLLSYFA